MSPTDSQAVFNSAPQLLCVHVTLKKKVSAKELALNRDRSLYDIPCYE